MADITADKFREISQTPDKIQTLPTTTLAELRRTTAPAILIETAFISNPSDAALMGNDATLDKLADNLYSAVSIMLNDYTIR